MSPLTVSNRCPTGSSSPNSRLSRPNSLGRSNGCSLGIVLGGIVLATVGVSSRAAIAQVSMPIPISPNAIPVPSAAQQSINSEAPASNLGRNLEQGLEQGDEITAQLEAELNSQLASEQWGNPRANSLPIFSQVTPRGISSPTPLNSSSSTTADGIPITVTKAPQHLSPFAAAGFPNPQASTSSSSTIPPLDLPSDKVPVGHWNGRGGVKEIALADMPWVNGGGGGAWATGPGPSALQAQYRVVVATPSSRHQEALKQMMPEAQSLQRKQAMQVGAFAEWNRARSLQRALSSYGFQVEVEAL